MKLSSPSIAAKECFRSVPETVHKTLPLASCSHDEYRIRREPGIEASIFHHQDPGLLGRLHQWLFCPPLFDSASFIVPVCDVVESALGSGFLTVFLEPKVLAPTPIAFGPVGGTGGGGMLLFCQDQPCAVAFNADLVFSLAGVVRVWAGE